MTRDKEKCPFSALTGVCIKQVDFIDSLKNNFLSYTAFITKYNIKKNYLEYYEVVFAIEKKRFPRSKPHYFGRSRWKPVLFQKSLQKDLTANHCQKNWLAGDIFSNEQGNWENTYQLPFVCTTETKLRVFHYLNFTHRRIATNDFLRKTGKKETDSCAFCADSPEDDKIISAHFKNNNVRFKSRNSAKVVLVTFLHSTTANAIQLNHGVTQEIECTAIRASKRVLRSELSLRTKWMAQYENCRRWARHGKKPNQRKNRRQIRTRPRTRARSANGIKEIDQTETQSKTKSKIPRTRATGKINSHKEKR